MHGSFILLKDGARYLDPGVPAQWKRLTGATDQEGLDEVWRAVDELLVDELPRLEERVYFPVPMAHQRSEKPEVLRDRFSYRMIEVDADQHWTWNGTPVAQRTRLFFTSHLGFEPSNGRYFFEYQVNPEWIDKSYLKTDMTPVVARGLKVDAEVLTAELNVGRRETLVVDSFRFDAKERILCASASFPEVLIEDNERFRLLRGLSEDLVSTRFEGLDIRFGEMSAAGESPQPSDDENRL